MSNVKTYTIKSLDRTSGDRSNFALRLEEPIVFNQVRLEECIIPNSWYNMESVTLSYNDGAVLTVSLNGAYTAISLSQDCSSQQPGYVVTWSDIKQRFVITHAAPFTLTISSSEAARRIGFDNVLSSSSVIAGVNTILSNRPPDLNVFKNIFIDIRDLGLSNRSSEGLAVSFTFKVPVSSNSGNYLIYQENMSFFQETFSQEIPLRLGNIEVRLCDDSGAVINQQYINDWMFSLRLL